LIDLLKDGDTLIKSKFLKLLNGPSLKNGTFQNFRFAWHSKCISFLNDEILFISHFWLRRRIVLLSFLLPSKSRMFFISTQKLRPCRPFGRSKSSSWISSLCFLCSKRLFWGFLSIFATHLVTFDFLIYFDYFLKGGSSRSYCPRHFHHHFHHHESFL